MPGTLSAFGRGWRAPYAGHRVFFAGTEAANHWYGYMEGGYEAGERAAVDALVSLGRLSPGTRPPPLPATPANFARPTAPPDWAAERATPAAAPRAKL